MTFGSYIKRLRLENNLSSRKLAERSGISQGYLSQLETGANKNPSPEIVKKLANGLNADYTLLMYKAGYITKDFLTQINEKDNRSNENFDYNNQASQPYPLYSIKDKNSYGKKPLTLLEIIELCHEYKHLKKNDNLGEKPHSLNNEELKNTDFINNYLVKENFSDLYQDPIDLYTLLRLNIDTSFKQQLLTKKEKKKILNVLQAILGFEEYKSD
ncbi:helix-turn-helix domain-containing protein [Pseudogracilibacillus sp. SO30301A]|uniref:helix-turn-helix domain-containing protein n=1 Tax=Pseudogracilibacillus sp. SO30301A TaxID=3098291 RepID=UPI00300E1987